jgi:hypothetical protein
MPDMIGLGRWSSPLLRGKLASMPVALVFEEPSLFIMRAHGVVTYDEVRLAISGMLADSHFRAGAVLFIDNRGVTSTPTIAEVAGIANHFSEVFARGVTKVALLSDSEEVHTVAKMFASFASTVGADARGFRDERKAREWLQGSH